MSKEPANLFKTKKSSKDAKKLETLVEAMNLFGVLDAPERNFIEELGPDLSSDSLLFLILLNKIALGPPLGGTAPAALFDLWLARASELKENAPALEREPWTSRRQAKILVLQECARELQETLRLPGPDPRSANGFAEHMERIRTERATRPADIYRDPKVGNA